MKMHKTTGQKFNKRQASSCLMSEASQQKKKRKISIATGIYTVVVPSGDHKKIRSANSALVLPEPKKVH